MRLARGSVARPVLTSMITLIVVVVGAVALFSLDTDLLPPIELPSLSVQTRYEGANPEVVERLVTEIVEEIVGTVPGVEELSSQSSEGESSVSLRFAWGTDIDTAAIDVRSKLEDELSELPEGVLPPQIRKFDIASFPVVILGVSSALDPVELTTLVDEQIRPRIARVPGVAQVDPWGEYEREIRVEVNPERLRAFGVGLDEVSAAIQGATLDLPTGSIEEGDREIALRAPSELTSLEELERTVVATRSGAPVRISDLAVVVDTHRRLDRLARINGRLGLRLGVRKQADANTVDVSRGILEAAERINREIPQVEVIAVSDQGDFIERSIANVARSVLYGGVLAILVLLFFLRDLRSTLIIALAIPVSLVATFALIYLADYTLNLMTLGGLALGIGMMVDNSIVVLDNIFRNHREHPERDRVAAAITGTGEVAAAIVASTLTTLVIFLPLGFLRGVAGQLFRELAVVVAFSLACSLLVALTLVPMLASRWLREDAPAPTRGLSARLGAALEAVTALYRRALAFALDNPWRVGALSALSLAASVAVVPTLDTELLPPSDEGEVQVSGEMPIGTRLDLVDRQTRRLEALTLPEVPESTATLVSVGTTGRRPGDAATGTLRLTLTPSAERDRSNEEIARALRRTLEGQVPGMDVRVRAPQGQFLLQRILGEEGGGLGIEVLGPELAQLDALADRAVEVAEGIPGVTDVQRSREAAAPQVDLRTDREAAADRGVDPAAVARALRTAVAGEVAGDYRVGSTSHRILGQLADTRRRPRAEILDLTIRNDAGQLVRLAEVTTTDEVRAPLVIDRKDQRRIVTVTPNVADRPTGTVAQELQEALDEIPRPAGYELRVAGTYEEQEQSTRELVFAFGLAIVLVFMVLAGQYESLRDPWIVMLSVPMAATGVVVALAATRTTRNVQSNSGCIMLGGIVVNNAVLLVDQASQLRAGGADVREALFEAGRRRLRPILMTTSTTALALVPLALGIGEGADAQAPLARAVLGGLTASTVFTLVLVPAAYLLLHRGGGA